MPICHNHRQSDPYAKIYKNCIYDSNLSWKAKGILAYIFSRPDTWQFYQSEIESNSNDGKDSLKSGLKELEDKGYLYRCAKQSSETGLLDGTDWHVFEVPLSPEQLEEFKESLNEFKKSLPRDGFSVERLFQRTRKSAPTKKEEEKKEKKKNFIEGQSSSSNLPAACENISFSFSNFKFLGITSEDLKTWTELHPSLDISLEIKKAEEWCKNNPSKAKKRKLKRKFLSDWFKREVEYTKSRKSFYDQPVDKKVQKFIDLVNLTLKNNKDRSIEVYSNHIIAYSEGKPFKNFYFNSKCFIEDCCKYLDLTLNPGDLEDSLPPVPPPPSLSLQDDLYNNFKKMELMNGRQ